MTFEEFIANAGWQRGGSAELISGGNWRDPITGEWHWNIREPVRIQAEREAARMVLILERCTSEQRLLIASLLRAP